MKNKFRTLATKFGVSGIPALIVVKSNGDVVSKNARSEVQVFRFPPILNLFNSKFL